MPLWCASNCHLCECVTLKKVPLCPFCFFSTATIDFQTRNKWLRYLLRCYRTACSECASRHKDKDARTRTGLISLCDYAWHVQSGSGDVINLFQQETDAWMSHANTHTDIHTQTHTHVCCQGNKANVTVSRKQSPKSAAWHSVIIPSRIFTFRA